MSGLREGEKLVPRDERTVVNTLHGGGEVKTRNKYTVQYLQFPEVHYTT